MHPHMYKWWTHDHRQRNIMDPLKRNQIKRTRTVCFLKLIPGLVCQKMMSKSLKKIAVLLSCHFSAVFSGTVKQHGYMLEELNLEAGTFHCCIDINKRTLQSLQIKMYTYFLNMFIYSGFGFTLIKYKHHPYNNYQNICASAMFTGQIASLFGVPFNSADKPLTQCSSIFWLPTALLVNTNLQQLAMQLVLKI